MTCSLVVDERIMIVGHRVELLVCCCVYSGRVVLSRFTRCALPNGHRRHNATELTHMMHVINSPAREQ